MHPNLMGELDLLAGLGRLDHPEDRLSRSHSPPAGMEYRLTVQRRDQLSLERRLAQAGFEDYVTLDDFPSLRSSVL